MALLFLVAMSFPVELSTSDGIVGKVFVVSLCILS